MPTIISHHNITKSTEHWLTSPKRKEFFGSARSDQHPNVRISTKSGPGGW